MQNNIWLVVRDSLSQEKSGEMLQQNVQKYRASQEHLPQERRGEMLQQDYVNSNKISTILIFTIT